MPLLEATNVTKSFSGVSALSGASFTVLPGEIHALAGENGAGKSTLINILSGVLQPDQGVLSFKGQTGVRFANPAEAQRAGIAVVHQEHSLFPELSIAENLFVNAQPLGRLGLIHPARMQEEARHWLHKVGLDLDPRQKVRSLSPAQQQMVEIAKALRFEASLFILDEPTQILSETVGLFTLLRSLQSAGVSIVYISHRLEEVFALANRVSVLKDGRMQGTWLTSEITTPELISKMVGRVPLYQRPAVPTHQPGPVILQAQGLCDKKLRNVSLSLRSGEIVALAGLEGAGRTELAMALFGARRLTAGEIRIDGAVQRFRSPDQAIRAGIGYVTEDRKQLGLFLSMDVANNIAAARLHHFGGRWFHPSRAAAVAKDFIASLRIVTPGVRQAVKRLSGGNQQKVLLARWLLVQPRVLIVDEPTRGVDIGAKAEIHSLLRDLARQGMAILVISSELPEVLALADRILVMRAGEIRAELSPAATEEQILHYAAVSLTSGKVA